MSKTRQRIFDNLREKDITCSSQVINALYYAVTLSGPDIVGCSDSLLMGLLRSGSYTVEALLNSGVNSNCLIQATEFSVGYRSDGDLDHISMLFASQGEFGRFINHTEKDFIETSDLLEIAISPESLDGEYTNWFPKHLRKTNPPDSSYLVHLEDQACFVIDTCAEIISRSPYKTLEHRSKPLTQPEKEKIIDELCDYDLVSEQFNWAFTLTDMWLKERDIKLDYPEKTLGIVSAIQQDVRYGASLFTDNGGDFKILSSTLTIAKKLAPERDQPFIGLIEREGRIFVKHYSYSSSISVAEDRSNVFSIGTEIPLPLTTNTVISEFENLLNSTRLNENQIQLFLERYPEMLLSLGYSSCIPHVILRDPGKNDLIPDFILQKPGNNGFDILDLKLPSSKISVSNPYLRISHEITKALAQLRAYRNYFKSDINRNRFQSTYNLEPMSPELIVVIGRVSQDISFIERIEIQKQAPGLKIVTYDELIDYGKSKAINLNNLANKAFHPTR